MKIVDYDIVSDGVHWPDYWQARGLVYTEFTDRATGIGNSEYEAAQDALFVIIEQSRDEIHRGSCYGRLGRGQQPGTARRRSSSRQDRWSGEFRAYNNGDGYAELGEQPYYYVTIRVR